MAKHRAEDLKGALGRDAVYGAVPSSPAAPTARRRPGRPRRDDGGSWEDTHSRATYHLPRTLQEAVTEAAATSGRSKSQVVADALRQHLKIKG